jgi:hypothetical protein
VKTGAEILALAKKTTFVEEGRCIDDHGNRRYEYVPAPHTPDALLEFLTQGLLVHRVTISGASPSDGSLPSGTYYTYIDFVESPEFNEARWIARVIDDTGQVVRIVPNVEIKQVFNFQPESGVLSKVHSKPSIVIHGIADASVEKTLFPGAIFDGAGWIHSTSAWSALASSHGCSQTAYCEPKLQ